MNTAEFIGLKSARDLLGFTEKVYSDFCQAPTETQLITLIFSLNHMREWISGGQKWNEIKKVDKAKRNSGQILHGDIQDIPEFINVLNPLCNGLKHFSISLVTEPISGARSGLLRVGDSLSQQYFTINGIDSRNIFYKILEKYRDYFATSKC